jgi:hypothetical protein
MPITDLGSYVTTGNEFDGHWNLLNQDRSANALPELTLVDGYSKAQLTMDVAFVSSANNDVEDQDNAVDIAAGNRDALKAALRERIMDFRDAVEYKLKNTGYVRALPETPHEDASEQKTLKALSDIEALWTRIDFDLSVPNFSPPLLLRGVYAITTLTSDVSLLRTNYKSVSDAEAELRLARRQRDILLKPIRERFVEYREAVKVEYGDEHPFFTSLPDVYPAPGSTPDAVILSGGWDSGQNAASLTWPPSTDPNLDHYEVRMTPGPTYDTANDSVIGNLDPGTLNLLTTDGIPNPGDTASYKVYVILTTGNEAGSNTVTVTRV